MAKQGKEIIGGPVVVGGNRIPLSKGVRAGDFVFVSGQVPFAPDGSIVKGTIEARLSGSDFVDTVHGVDSTPSRAFGRRSGQEKGSTPCSIRILCSIRF